MVSELTRFAFAGKVFKLVPETNPDDPCDGCALRKTAACLPSPDCTGSIYVEATAALPGTGHVPPITGKTASEVSMILSEDPAVRKATPITTGVLDYFPRALAAVAQCSKAGNDQHNPGQPLHWDKTKSLDHADCIARHLIDRNTVDTDGIRHAAKLAWRALALLETMLEAEQAQ